MKGYTVEFNQNYEWDMQKFHFHDYYEILLSLTEAGSFWVDSNSFNLHRGTLILMAPGLLHRSNASPDTLYQRFILRFSPEYGRSVSSPSTNLLSCFLHSECVHLLDEEQIGELSTLLGRCANPGEGFGADLRANAAFVELMLHVCGLAGRLESAPAVEGRDFKRLEPVLHYIKENLAEPLTLDDIARQVYLSKHYLCALFKRTTGFSVGEYIISCRVVLAQQYLRQGAGVQHSGELAGFANNSHFIRTFHNMVGYSPGQYAKRYKNLSP